MYQRIRDLREDRDLLQKDVAAYLKCTQVCYSNYETGKRDIPTEVLIQLAAVRSAINNTGKVILKNHLDHCIVEAVEQNDMETIRALDEAIDKFIK